MPLQDLAAKETSALINRLLAQRSDALTRQLRAVYDALDTAGRALAASPDIDEEIREFVGRLNGAFGDAAERIRDEDRKLLAEVRRDLDSERTANETLRASVSMLETELERESGAVERYRAELHDADARTAAAERDLAAAHETVRQLEEARVAANAASRVEAQARTSLEEELRDTRSIIDESTVRIAELETELDAERRRADDSVTRYMDVEGALTEQLRDVRGALDESLAEAAQLGAQLEEIAGEKGRLSIDLGTTQGELQMARAQQKAVAAQLKASIARAHMLERSQADTIDQLQGRLEAALPVAAGGQPNTTAPRVETPAPGLELVTEQVGAARLASVVEASVRSVEELTRADSIADLLGGLARELATQFCRVALFRVEGNRLRGEHQVGFDYTTDVRVISTPLSVDSLLTRVARTGEMERLAGGELTEGTKGAPFRGRPTLALALPILLRGETVAVAYVDNWDQPASVPGRGSEESSLLFARLLIRHTGVLFVAHAHELRTLTELREYASRLLQGAEQMYVADAETRIGPDALQNRLEDNLACARHLFAQRATLEGPAAAGLLDEQLAATIASDPSAPFARDLAAIAVRAREAETRRAAEAC